ncbi:ecto-ADP-ribosyltransferase 5-like [Pelodytes ibericus]
MRMNGPGNSDSHEDDMGQHLTGAAKSKGKSTNQNPAQTQQLWPERKCNLLNLDFGPNAFDDQYKGCSETLEEDLMPKVLILEKSLNPEFGSAWSRAEKQWKKIKAGLRLPDGFRDEFGIAIQVYTTDWPTAKPIYKTFNGNVSRAGRSRDCYMQSFHFKALHFYLTRALQVLKKRSKKRHQTFRGTDDSYEVSEATLRFGRFTSTSLNVEVAKEYYSGLLFEIMTCFGVDIHRISFFPKEKEILIPVAEKFRYIGKKGNVYLINSTCELCSYFNCAYLGDNINIGQKIPDSKCKTYEKTSKLSDIEAVRNLRVRVGNLGAQSRKAPITKSPKVTQQRGPGKSKVRAGPKGQGRQNGYTEIGQGQQNPKELHTQRIWLGNRVRTITLPISIMCPPLWYTE